MTGYIDGRLPDLVSGYLPQSESELEHARPVSNIPGALPPESVLYGEKIIYETRPRALSVHPVAIWVSIVFLGFVVLLDVVGGTGNGYGLPTLLTLGLVLGFPELVILAWALGSARRTSYALTDQRVILRKGNDFVSAPYQQISRVDTKPKSSTVVFQLAPAPGSGTPTPVKPIVWQGVRGAPAVAAYAMSATRYYGLRQQQKMLRQDLVTASMEDKIVCEYCHAYIPIASLNPDHPQCPKCSAPIAVAPLGM